MTACGPDHSGYKDFIPDHQDSINKAALIKRAYYNIRLAAPEIKNGDLITRTGNDFTSQSLKSLNQRNQTYSHCGIASIENDSIFIYHSLGGEWNPDQKIRRDPYELFAEPYSNNGFGIFRFEIPDSSIAHVLSTVKEFYAQGIMFDMDFNLASNDRMYCAEFVYKSFVRGTNGSLDFPLSHINKFKFIGVDDIFLHPQCNKIRETLYK